MNRVFLRYNTLFFILLLGSFFPVRATHIVGGDITYRALANNNYRIQVYLYVDCWNGVPDAIASDIQSKIGVFGSNNMLLQSLSVTRSGPQRISASNYSCVIPPANACVDLYIYEAFATLPPRPGGYQVVFQRCCRNNTITNLTTPESTGSTYRTFIPGSEITLINNSAKYKGLPPNFLCVNEPLTFDHSAEDLDGDSLVYSLCVPLHGADRDDPVPDNPANFPPPFSNVLWRNPYTAGNQMGGNPQLSVDPHTGLMVVTPTAIGQFVVGVCVSEFRNGILINTVLRDFQFNVSNCVFDVKANFAPVFERCGNTVNFQNNSIGGAEGYQWDFGISGIDNDTSIVTNPSFVYPGPGEYTITLKARKGTCFNTVKKNIHILESDIAGFFEDSMGCVGNRIQLGVADSDPRVNYRWSPATGLDNATIANPVATIDEDIEYTVTKSSVSCFIEEKVKVRRDPLKADFVHEYLPPCDGLRVRYYSRNSGDIFHTWDFGDPATILDVSTADSTSWFYTDSGLVYVKMKVYSQYCVDSVVKPIKIYIPDIFTTVTHFAICMGDSLRIGPASDTSILSFTWNTIEFLDDPLLLYPVSKPTRSISYALTKQYEYCYRRDSFLIDVNEIPDFSAFKEEEGELCPGNEILLWASGDYNFEWSPKSSLVTPFEKQTIARPTESTLYTVVATTEAGCTQQDTIGVNLYTLYEIDLDPQYIVCKGEVLLPDPQIPDSRITWLDESGKAIDSIRREGTYLVNVKTQCQDLTETIKVVDYTPSYCRLDLPNSFTPNLDGVNDSYPFGGNFHKYFGAECEFLDYQLIIFDRWGEIVFRSTNPGEEWNGAYKDQDSPIVVYGYFLQYRETDWCTGDLKLKVKKGNITVMQ